MLRISLSISVILDILFCQHDMYYLHRSDGRFVNCSPTANFAVHQLVSAMNCFTNELICPFEVDLVLHDIWFGVFELEHCCNCPILDDDCLKLPQLVLVQRMCPIQFILKVVVIQFIEEMSQFAWILLDAKVAVEAAEVFFDSHD